MSDPAGTGVPSRVHADRDVDGRVDRGAPPQHREPTWPAAGAVLTAIVLRLALPEGIVSGPRWLIPALEALLLIPLFIAVPHRSPDDERWVRPAGMALAGVVTIANAVALAGLVSQLLEHPEPGALPGGQVLVSAVVIWVTNIIIFALWYWELDGDGPGPRRGADPPLPEFLFPQLDNPRIAPPGWRPQFLDYLYLSITNTTAFSPTDTMPLTASAKALMSLQAFASMLLIGLVVARAINIL
jgi:uncharacterized membrane protein